MSGTSTHGHRSATERRAAVAGLFYPRDPLALDATIAALLREQPAMTPAPKVLVVPHAGYPYSGALAARAYATLGAAAASLERVVLLGPSHRVWLQGFALPVADRFLTPLGALDVDAAVVGRLCSLPGVRRDEAPHRQEHCLEVQLPFLQRVAPQARIVPILVGEATPAEVAAVLEAAWGGAETLVVISTDLSHYHAYDEARRRDADTAAAVLAASGGLRGDQACGCVALNGLARVASQRRLRGELIGLCNSGDTAGDRQRVVGYGAFGFYDA